MNGELLRNAVSSTSYGRSRRLKRKSLRVDDAPSVPSCEVERDIEPASRGSRRMMPMRANIVGPPRSATRNSASM
ncbi:hypothetical protein Q3C01_43080, partial [Bradyrhizobium sp. UFLA05-109]